MNGGYMGKILYVDLSEKKIWDEPLDEKQCNDFIGGYGIGANILFEQQKAGVDPLGHDAMLGFVTGPLTGTPALIGSRYTVVGKSPLTGTWGDANSGGDFGPHLKFAGYDAVFFKGISEQPVYLNIENGKAVLRDADHLWGIDTSETEAILQSEQGKTARVACIGTAGENLSLISCIMNNKGRAAGRSGLGAVMGSKMLKAITVNGNLKVPIAYPAELKEARRRYLHQMKEAVIFFMINSGGTAGLMEFLHLTGEAPCKNWGGAATVDFADIEPLLGPAVDKLTEKRYGCWHCPIGCGGLMKAGTGKYKYKAGVHRPEYETIAAFGNMCLNSDLESIITACDMCNRHGLDTISTGSSIAFAIECFENGILSEKDTDGIKLNWGNHQAIVEMTKKIINREGLGAILANGVKSASEQIGRQAEQFAIHVNGQEPGLHDPRANIPFATTFLYATPGRHTQGNEGTTAEGLPMPIVAPDECDGRGEAHKTASNYFHVVNSAGLCYFGNLCMKAEHVHEFLNLVTGTDHNMDEILKIGERIGNIRQAFNIREGITAKAFRLPGRILGNPPLPDGPTAGKAVDLDTLRTQYFNAMDWDPHTGKPHKTKLMELGLVDVAQALWPSG